MVKYLAITHHCDTKSSVCSWLSMNDLLVLLHYYSIELHIIIDTVAVSLALLLAVFNAAGIIIISANEVSTGCKNHEISCVSVLTYIALDTS